MPSQARPAQNISNAITYACFVKSGTTLSKGQCVIATANPYEVDAAVAASKIFGIVLDDPAVVGDGVKRCTVVLGNAIVYAIVGTGGCTYGKEQIMASDGTGLTDQTLGAGTTVRHVIGTALETGVAGDLVAILINRYDSVSA